MRLHAKFFRKNLLLTYLVVICLSTLAIFPSIVHAQTTVFVDPSSVTANPEESFTVNINVADVASLWGWQFKLSFKSSLLEVTDIYEGPFLSAGGGQTTVFTRTIDNFLGYVDVGCVVLFGVPISGSGVLATINFTVLDTGESALTLYDTELLDPVLNPISHTTADGYFYTTWPVADFEYTPDSYGRPIVGEDVTFDASASYDPDGGSIDSYEWDFGDNLTGTGKIAAHAYEASGDYNVTLVVTDDEGNTTTWRPRLTSELIGIKFHDIAVTNVTADPQRLEIGNSTQIYVAAMNNGSHRDTFNVTVYYFDGRSPPIGDGLYHFIATYNKSIELAPGESVTLGEEPTGDYMNSNLIWNTTGVDPGLYPIYAYAYLVDPFRPGIPSQFRPGEEENTVNNARLGGPVNVGLPEEHDIAITGVTVTPNIVRVGQTVMVDVRVKNEGNVVETFTVNVYNGSLGPGVDPLVGTQNMTLTPEAQKTLHFSWFDAANTTFQGSYNVSAQVPAVTGETDVADNTFLNVTGMIQLLPVAYFTFLPDDPTLDQTITFDASASYAPGIPTKTLVSYSWDFGDGASDTGMTTTHVYAASGKYSVMLTVVDSDSLSNTLTKSVTVSKMTSTITISASATTVPVSSQTTITGAISPVHVGANVSVYYRLSGDDLWISLADVTTDDDGLYSYAWTVWLEPGTYEVKADWPGDETNLPAESSVLSVDVIQKIVSVIDISLSSTTVMIGDSVSISGSISPVRAGVVVTILYMPGGSDWSTLTTVTTDAEAEYAYTWEPEESGTYALKASWPGDETTDADESDVQTVVVEYSELNIFMFSTIALAIAFAASIVYFLFLKKPKPAT